MAHRHLIGAALSGQKCTLTGFDYSEEKLAVLIVEMKAEIKAKKERRNQAANS